MNIVVLFSFLKEELLDTVFLILNITFLIKNINENNKNFYQNNFIINYIKVLQKAHNYNKIFN